MVPDKLTMEYITLTMYHPEWHRCIASWGKTATHEHRMQVIANKPIVEGFQLGYERARADILAHIHDDVLIYEQGWDDRVLREFENPDVGLVGFGGALGHGHPDLYNVPYHLPNLARQTFLSNMEEAEVHGQRFTGERDVAVLDGFAFFVRKSVLDAWGGWVKARPYGYWLYLESLCCGVRRQGYRIRLVGVYCHHLGGRSSTNAQITDDYETTHRLLFDNNRDMLPYRVSF